MSLLDLVPAGIRALSGYHLPSPEGIHVKLDANESPFPLSPEDNEDLCAALAAAPLHRYPDASASELVAVIAEDLGCATNRIVLGNGSDELIHLLIQTFGKARPGHARAGIAYPWPAFVVFRMATLVHDAEPVEVLLDADFELDGDLMVRRVREARPNVVFFPRPNNPTGGLWSETIVRDLLAAAPDTLVIVDEAYFEYAGTSVLGWIGRYPNLVVMRTLSKVGLAAARIGFLVMDPALAAEVEKVRQPYNVGALNQAAAIWMLRDRRELMRAHVSQVIDERERLLTALAAMPGVRPYPSAANFVLFRVADAPRVWQRLVDAGLLLRKFDPSGPLGGCLRVTVGTPAENALFTAALDGVVAATASSAGR